MEYAISTIAAAAFGAMLYTVITGDSIISALTTCPARATARAGPTPVRTRIAAT
jgi:Protein of unknown function (DUF4244)